MSIDFSQLNFKKIIFVVLFLVLCFGLGFGIYYLFFRTPEPKPGEPGWVPPGANLPLTNQGVSIGTGTGAGGLPEIGEEKIGEEKIDKIAQGGLTETLPLHADKVSGLTLSSNSDGVNFYNQTDNKFYTLSSDGRDLIPLSEQEFFEVQDVFWSADKSKAIISYPDGSKVIYDFVKQEQLSLNKEIQEPVFGGEDRVAYKYLSPDNNWLTVADTKGTQVDLIEPLGDQSSLVQVTWSPTNQVVALYAKPTGLDQSEVFFIGLKDENFRSLMVDGTNFKGLWSPSGVKLLYQVVNSANNFNPALFIVEAEGDNIGRHKFNLGLSTWVDKCIFASEAIVYCAVPRQLPEGAGLYPELVPETKDLIYRIDLATGFKDLVADPILDGANNFSIGKIYLSSDGRYLFFYDKITEKVYRMQLK